MLLVPIESYVLEVRPIGEDATIGHARELLDRGGEEVLPVVDGRGRTVGVLSRSDLFRAARASQPPVPRASRPPEAQVSSVMTRGPVVVAPSTSVGEAASIMVDRHIHHLFVEADQRTVGVFGVLQVMRALIDAEVALPLSAIMTRPVRTIRSDCTIAEATDLLAQDGISGLAVMEEGAPVGVFTKRDAINAASQPEALVKHVLEHRSATLSASTPAYVAARGALSRGLPHILVTGDHAASEGAPMLVGIVTGIDLAGAAVIAPGSAHLVDEAPSAVR